MGGNTSLLGQVVAWIIIGFVAIVAIKIVLGLLGMVFGLAAFLLFTVAPVLLVGWLVMKAWKAFTVPAT